MNISTITLSVTEIFILLSGVIVFGITLYFFITSRKSLKEVMASGKKQIIFPEPLEPESIYKEENTNQLFLAKAIDNTKRKTLLQKVATSKVSPKKNKVIKDDLLDSFEAPSFTPPKPLSSNLNSFNTRIVEESEIENEEVETLRILLEQKEFELKSVKQEAIVAQKMAARLEDVYKEFDLLQRKVAGLEKQSSLVANLTLELEDLKQANEQLRKDIERKQEKLEQAIVDNQRLHTQLSETENKLAEVNLQRQQLHKKVQLLQNVNDNLLHVSEANKKLKTELRRVGELESMLDIMQEEQNELHKT